MMQLMAIKYQDSTEEEEKAISQFKQKTIQLYLYSRLLRSCSEWCSSWRRSTRTPQRKKRKPSVSSNRKLYSFIFILGCWGAVPDDAANGHKVPGLHRGRRESHQSVQTENYTALSTKSRRQVRLADTYLVRAYSKTCLKRPLKRSLQNIAGRH